MLIVDHGSLGPVSPFAVLKLVEQIGVALDDKPVEPRRTVQFILSNEEPNQEVPGAQAGLGPTPAEDGYETVDPPG